MTRLINIDNGGTLTDICVVDGEEVRYTKTLTTPFDLSRCLFDGLAKASALLYGEERMPSLLQSTDYIRYSTTQGTNALVQRKGPRLGLLVTDPALIGRLTADPAQRELLDALVGDRWASVTLAGDEELSAELVTTINDLAGRGASRLVVSIGGEAGPAEERRIRGLLLRLYPRHLLGAVPLVFSWELLGGDRDDIRRTWSSLLNAFLHPAMERFLFNTQQRLREQRTRRPLLIFRNDGGSSRVSKSSAIKTYSSGPRGGLEGTRALAGHYGFRHLLMVDVGGTTTDIGAVTGGKVRIDRRGLIGGVPSSLPLAAIASHGVGGSSVIRVTDGRITVGPDSVGAAPGPACFGLGGTAATITDVYLLMGILDPATYLGGDLKLDTDRSAKAVTATIAEPLHVTLPEALALMEEAYVHSAAQALLADGPLPDDTVLAAFGGAGPMTICGAARQAGARQVIVPRTAAVFSAFGIGFSDLTQDYQYPLAGAGDAAIARAVDQLGDRARRDMSAEGVRLEDCIASYRLVSEADGAETVVELDDPEQARAHFRDGDTASLELSLVSPLPHVGIRDTGSAPASSATASGVRSVLDRAGGAIDLPVYTLLDLPAAAQADGPAVIEGPFFTMRLPAGWRFQTTAAGDLLLTDQGSN